MKKLLVAIGLLIFTYSANAAEITFLENPTWSTVLEKAKKENKMIFLDAFATWCGPCKKMDAETYKDQAVADFYNANFINVKFDMEKGEGTMLAQRYGIQAYPNLLFISPEGDLLHKGVGFMDAGAFVDLAKSAKNPTTQYYTLKKKALQLNAAEFLKFAEQATAVEDEDFDVITSDYLAKQADVLGGKELVRIVMEYANALPDEKTLAYVIDNKAKISATGLYTPEEIEGKFVTLALGFSLSEDVQSSDQIDFEAVKKVLDKYVPERSFFVFNYFKIQYLLDNKESTKALETVDLLLSSYPEKSSLDQICNALMNLGPEIFSLGKLDKVLKKFDEIKVLPKDAGKAYLKNFTKAVIFLKAKETEKFKQIANTMLASAETPKDVKADLQEALKGL